MNETPEDTFRVLKGKQPVQRFFCRVFEWHRWTNWEIRERNPDYGTPVMRSYCADCGAMRVENPITKNNK